MRNYPNIKLRNNDIDEIWSIDLADMVDYKISNIKDYRYIFIIIDNFSKHLWSIPPKNNYSQIVANEFSSILTTSKRSPGKVESDRGAESHNSTFQSFLKAKSIQHYSRFTDKSKSIAERVFRKLFSFLKEPVFEKGNANWLSELPSVIKQNNNTIRNSIKMTPIQTSKK